MTASGKFVVWCLAHSKLSISGSSLARSLSVFFLNVSSMGWNVYPRLTFGSKRRHYFN